MATPIWSRRKFLGTAISGGAALTDRRLWAKQSDSVRVYFGTLSRPGGRGIYRAEWNAERGELTPITLAVEAKDASFILSCPARAGLPAMIYGATENRADSGDVFAFRVETDGGLTPAGRQPSGGKTPVHLSVDRTGSLLLAANYTSGSLECYRRNKDGSLSVAQQHFQYEGHGLSPQRQSGPRTHGTIASPDNRFMLVNDLGLDKIMIYMIDPATFRLTPHEPFGLDATPGSGPRHSLFHPNKRWVFCINELDCTVTTLGWNGARGTLTLLSAAKILPEGHNSYLEQMRIAGPSAAAPGNSSAPTGGAGNIPAGQSAAAPAPARGNAAAELCLSSDGRFVYATNRGEYDCVTVFAVDAKTGALTTVQSVVSGGRNARHVVLDPSERWALLCCQDSSEVVVFRRDVKTGMLAEHHRYELPGAGTTVFAQES
jgi:6-phosphogluconolactonase